MSDSKTTGNVVDGFGGRLQTDETGVELQAAPGTDVNIKTTEGGQLLVNGSPVGGGSVTSVFGRTGDVVPVATDYTDVPHLTFSDDVGTQIQFNGSSGPFGGLFITVADGSQFSFDGSGGIMLLNQAGGLIQLNDDGTVNIEAGVLNGLILGGTPYVAAPIFHDNETPTTFTTNAEYVLAVEPAPHASLQVFIQSVASKGCDLLLVQGVDYHLGGTGNLHIIYTSNITTNEIRVFYRALT